MKSKEMINYCHISFINGISDAFCVIVLYKTFPILMTGNIVFLITGFAYKSIVDIARFCLIVEFLILEYVSQRYFRKIPLEIKISLSWVFLFFYIFIGEYFYRQKLIGSNNLGIVILTSLACLSSFVINSTFYSITETRINLILYTMNLLKIADCMAEKKYIDCLRLAVIIGSFCLGLLISAILIKKLEFYTLLLIAPAMISLLIVNLDTIYFREAA